MTLRNFAKNVLKGAHSHGLRGGFEAAQRGIARAVFRQLGKAGYNAGTNIFDRKWDLLIILDACRIDLLEEEIDRHAYDYIRSPDTHTSPASASEPWMEKTFCEEYTDEMAKTAYITANPFSEYKLSSNDFYLLDEVWKDQWDDELGTVRPRPVTDRAIKADKSQKPERMIVHYMQPHHPFITDPITEGFSKDVMANTFSIWNALAQNDISEERVWRAYRDNLTYVLQDLEVLLSNIDAEHAVISADHGNAVGEWSVYGHISGVPMNVMRKVPWYRVSAEDTGGHQPTGELQETSTSVEERLTALGYTNR